MIERFLTYVENCTFICMYPTESNSSCFKFYQQRFNIKDYSELRNILINLTRPARPSRTSLKRKLENAAFASRKKDGKTIIQCYNEFRQSISLANYRLCVICEQHFLESSALEIDNNDPLFESLSLNDNLHKRRMNRFWICTVCKSDGKKREDSFSIPFLKCINVDGHNILFPTTDQQEDDIEYSVDTLTMVPKTVPRGNNTNVKNYSIKLYNNQRATNKLLSTLYEQRHIKFLNRKWHADVYDCEISVQQNKKLNSVTKVYDDSMIRGSQRWWNNRRNAVHSMFNQFGQACIAFNIDIPFHNVETIVTSLICDGRVITLDYCGDVNDTQTVKYFLHDHENSIDCRDTCTMTELTNLEHISLESRVIPIFIASLHQKQSSYVEKFIKAKNFSFYSTQYFCRVDFYLSGDAHLSGCLWSVECDILNVEISNASLEGKTIQMNDFLHYIETSILTSVCSSSIKDSLGVSDEEAINIQNLATEHQVNLNIEQQHVPMPSYHTMYRIRPDADSEANIASSRVFIDICKTSLIKLSQEEKLSLSTEDWLYDLGREAIFDFHEESTIYIELQGKIMSFLIDVRLKKLMEIYSYFVGIYHYALSCSKKHYCIIMKRLKILDCFTIPFNVHILKAFRDRIEFVPIFGISDWYRFEEKHSKPSPDLDSTEVSDLLDTHYLVSLPELYALSDPKKIRGAFNKKKQFK